MPNESGCILGNCSSSYEDSAVNHVFVLMYWLLLISEKGEAEVNGQRQKQLLPKLKPGQGENFFEGDAALERMES